MPLTSAKITSKGQVTIPKEIRAKLGSNTVYFEVQGNSIAMKPVEDVAGALAKYAKNAPANLSWQEIKDKAWEEAVREKRGEKSTRH